jgi:hypothetical protein
MAPKEPITKERLDGRVKTSLTFIGAKGAVIAVGTGSEVFKNYEAGNFLRAVFLTTALLSAGALGNSWGEYKWQAAKFDATTDADKIPGSRSRWRYSRGRSESEFWVGFVLLFITTVVLLSAAWTSVFSPESPQPVTIVPEVTATTGGPPPER